MQSNIIPVLTGGSLALNNLKRHNVYLWVGGARVCVCVCVSNNYTNWFSNSSSAILDSRKACSLSLLVGWWITSTVIIGWGGEGGGGREGGVTRTFNLLKDNTIITKLANAMCLLWCQIGYPFMYIVIGSLGLSLRYRLRREIRNLPLSATITLCDLIAYLTTKIFHIISCGGLEGTKLKLYK